MRKILFLLVGLTLMFAQGKGMGMGAAQGGGQGAGGGMPQLYQTVSPDQATILQEGEAKQYCPNCGMDLVKHYKNGFATKLSTGEIRQYCSIHCYVDEREFGYLADKHDLIKEVLVVDVPSLKFIDATKAYFVVGSNKKGSMTGVSKYAFAKKSDAQQFMKENGGKIMDYKSTYKVALKDFENDVAMVKANRSKMIYKVGEEMYENKCDKDGLGKIPFHTVGELKARIDSTGVCGKGLTEPQLQAIALYFYDVKLIKDKKSSGAIDVPADVKCPICGMVVAKYPKWVAQITLKDGKTYYYDGVKDLYKHLLWTLDAKNVKEILATDYYSMKAIDLKKAYMVIGSDVYGPMGHELIPFASEKTAKEFMKDHHGKSILKFDEMTKQIVESLDK